MKTQRKLRKSPRFARTRKYLFGVDKEEDEGPDILNEADFVDCGTTEDK